MNGCTDGRAGAQPADRVGGRLNRPGGWARADAGNTDHVLGLLLGHVSDRRVAEGHAAVADA